MIYIYQATSTYIRAHISKQQPALREQSNSADSSAQQASWPILPRSTHSTCLLATSGEQHDPIYVLYTHGDIHIHTCHPTEAVSFHT